MIIEHYFVEEVNETNVYLCACQKKKKAAIIDAGGYRPELADRVQELGLSVQYILLTHTHYDHLDGLLEYCEAFPGVEVLAGGKAVGLTQVRLVKDREHLRLGDLALEARSIPGHTEDSIAWYVRAPYQPDPVVFCGDILFAGSVGGTSSEKNRQRELTGIREKLFALPGSTMLFPGHGPASTVAIESRHNPFFQ